MRLAALAVLAMPAVAVAQPGPDDPSPPGLTPPSVPAPPPTSAIELADHRDAAADRAFGSSTALVVPRGTADVSVRFGSGVLDASAAVGLGGGLELSADLGGGDAIGMVGGAVKLAVVRERNWGLAIEGGFHAIGDGEGTDTGVWSAGAAASACSDDQCAALFSVTGGVVGNSDHVEPYGTGSLLIGTGGLRAIFEAGAVSGGGAGFAGVRLGGRNVALDVGFVVAVVGEGAGAEPCFGLTIRP